MLILECFPFKNKLAFHHIRLNWKSKLFLLSSWSSIIDFGNKSCPNSRFPRFSYPILERCTFPHLRKFLHHRNPNSWHLLLSKSGFSIPHNLLILPLTHLPFLSYQKYLVCYAQYHQVLIPRLV